MSQIKYLVSAFLLLLVFAIVYVFVDKLLSTKRMDRHPVATGYTKRITATPTANVEGQNLFSANCATCHALDKVLTGPGLRGVTERGPWIERKRLIEWVHNPAAVIPKIAYTRELASAFNGQVMPGFPQLSEKDINAIFDYIETAPVSYGSVAVN